VRSRPAELPSGRPFHLAAPSTPVEQSTGSPPGGRKLLPREGSERSGLCREVVPLTPRSPSRVAGVAGSATAPSPASMRPRVAAVNGISCSSVPTRRRSRSPCPVRHRVPVRASAVAAPRAAGRRVPRRTGLGPRMPPDMYPWSLIADLLSPGLDTRRRQRVAVRVSRRVSARLARAAGHRTGRA
jgi:hypothetical protein